MNCAKSLFTKLILLLEKIGALDGSPDQEAAAAEPRRHNRNMDWAKIIAVSCWAAAIDIALQSSHSSLPITFYFLALAILFAITCVFVSSFIHSNYPKPAHLLERLGIFFGLTAFFIAIIIPFPSWFRYLTCFIYVVSWSAYYFVIAKMLSK
ncbi:hypothetical protein ACLB2K_044378 [Fragaria x ananassa]